MKRSVLLTRGRAGLLASLIAAEHHQGRAIIQADDKVEPAAAKPERPATKSTKPGGRGFAGFKFGSKGQR